MKLVFIGIGVSLLTAILVGLLVLLLSVFNEGKRSIAAVEIAAFAEHVYRFERNLNPQLPEPISSRIKIETSLSTGDQLTCETAINIPHERLPLEYRQVYATLFLENRSNLFNQYYMVLLVYQGEPINFAQYFSENGFSAIRSESSRYAYPSQHRLEDFIRTHEITESTEQCDFFAITKFEVM